jgi:hypothetical protein
MKKFFVSLVLFVSVAGTSTFASEKDEVNSQVQKSFQKEFAGARFVKWELIKENIYQAHFLYNDKRLDAYFSADGRLLATGRFIPESNLPLLVSRSIARKFDQYQVKDVVEYSQGDETSYLLTLENEKSTLIVQAYSSGSTYIFKKEKKNL